MKKIKLSFLALALALLAFTSDRPVQAGNIPAGIWCGSEQCTEENPAPMGYFWREEMGEQYQMYCSNCG